MGLKCSSPFNKTKYSHPLSSTFTEFTEISGGGEGVEVALNAAATVWVETDPWLDSQF